ncbi:MAG: amino acid permease, partial [Steroidobacteraceae bacterium]|nr:amino acid permease [Steroidobacteraceae bacterium]
TLHAAAGGHCAFAQQAFGQRIGLQAYLLYWVCCVAGNVAIAVAAIGYLASVAPPLAPASNAALAAIALIGVLTLLNAIGPRWVCQFDALTLAAGLLPIALVATLGWWHFDPQLFAAAWNVRDASLVVAVPQSLVLVFWAFLGLESAAVASAVVEHPQRNVPIATVGGVLLAGVVYLAASTVIFGLLPADRLANSTAPFADAAGSLLGAAAGSIVAVAAAVKAIGTLAGWLLVTAQTGQAAALQGLFPRILARCDSRGVPVLNLVLVAVLMSLAALATRSPALAEQFARLVEVSVILALGSYLYALAALPRLDASMPRPARRRDRGLAIVAALFCIGVIAASPADQLLLAGGVLALAIVAAAIRRDR